MSGGGVDVYDEAQLNGGAGAGGDRAAGVELLDGEGHVPTLLRIYSRNLFGRPVRRARLLYTLPMTKSFSHLDEQLACFSPKLRDDIRVPQEDVNQLASAMHRDCVTLGVDTIRIALRDDRIPLRQRHDELVAFQAWMDWAGSVSSNPAISRAQVITQLYIPFVYMRDTMFDAVRRIAPSGSTLKKVTKSLCDGDVRALRNAVAHGNWTYCDDFSGIRFWAAKGSDPADLEDFTMKQRDMAFWQKLARCAGYVIIETALMND